MLIELSEIPILRTFLTFLIWFVTNLSLNSTFVHNYIRLNCLHDFLELLLWEDQQLFLAELFFSTIYTVNNSFSPSGCPMKRKSRREINQSRSSGHSVSFGLMRKKSLDHATV